jgi:hypothetical protein
MISGDNSLDAVATALKKILRLRTGAFGKAGLTDGCRGVEKKGHEPSERC